MAKTYKDIGISLELFSRKKTRKLLLNDMDLYLQDIQNLIKTNTRERLFNYNIGADLYRYLFNMMPTINSNTLRQRISELISQYEPRIILRDVVITKDDDNNTINIKVLFTKIVEENEKIYSKEITFDFAELYRG